MPKLHVITVEHVSTFVAIIGSLVTICVAIVSGIVLKGYLNNAVIDAANKVGETWKRAAEAELKTNEELRKKLSDIDHRFDKLETEYKLQSLRLDVYKRKSEYQDSILRIIISIRSQLPSEPFERIQILLREMNEYTDKAEIEIIDMKRADKFVEELRRVEIRAAPPGVEN